MKYFKLFIIAFFVMSCGSLYAVEMTGKNYSLYVEQKSAEFAQQGGWYNLDSSIDYVSSIELEANTEPEDQQFVSNSFFPIFDYESSTESSLIDIENIKNKIFIKKEDELTLNVKYKDSYDNSVSANYPKLFYRKSETNDEYREITFSSANSDVFSFPLDDQASIYGTYDFYVMATNDKYPGVYTTPVLKFFVTDRPHSFRNLNESLQDSRGNAEINVAFNWIATAGVAGDTLKYSLYIGTDKDDMKLCQANTSSSYIAPNFLTRTRYYWTVLVENQLGVAMLNPQVYTFVTLGEIPKAYNAPNPFNPQKNEKTRIFFEMQQAGYAYIDIYSEYGDKIFHKTLNDLSAGNNEYTYDGKDDYGRTLYNGTYLCVIKKKFNGQTKTEKCRLLIIK